MKRREETPGVSVASAGGSWDQANSNNGKYWTTFKEFQIVWHHTPGEFNYLDICWVITKAIKMVPKLCEGQLYEAASENPT